MKLNGLKSKSRDIRYLGAWTKICTKWLVTQVLWWFWVSGLELDDRLWWSILGDVHDFAVVYFILFYFCRVLESLYLIIGCPHGIIMFYIIYYFYFRKTLMFLILIYLGMYKWTVIFYWDKRMACVFFF
jgi:hypothetical protein